MAITLPKAREVGRGHLLGGTPDIHGRPGDPALLERRGLNRLVDEVAVREVDEDRIAPHPRQGAGIDQVLGRLGGDRQAHDDVGLRHQRPERDPPALARRDRDVGIADQHLHSEMAGDRPEVPP